MNISISAICVTGDNFMSPGILAHLWVEEENKRKELEKKLRETLQTNQVDDDVVDDDCECFDAGGWMLGRCLYRSD